MQYLAAKYACYKNRESGNKCWNGDLCKYSTDGSYRTETYAEKYVCMSVHHLNLEFLLPMTIIAILFIALAISGTWSYFLYYMLKSFRDSPRLQKSLEPSRRALPRVSVIVPARNEEHYIADCLDRLITQDYPNFEIILIDDSSEDGTWQIMQNYAAKYKGQIVSLRAGLKPHGWVGKNWACYKGYLQCRGDLLLFTDADTQHSKPTMRLAEQYLWQQHADAITVVPRLLCKDLWTKMTLPILSIFLHTRFSALRVNNPKTKIGYFFGSFYLITRSAYEAVGTHKLVRRELIEDGALGAELKRQRFLIRMVRGEQYVSAVWARDFSTLWHGLRRLLIPLYKQNRAGTVLVTVAVILLLLAPFILLSLSLWLSNFHTEFASPNDAPGNLHLSAAILALTSASAVVLIFISAAVQSKLGVFQSTMYALCCPIAVSIICSCFVSSLNDARKGGSVTWRGRQYNMTEYTNTP